MSELSEITFRTAGRRDIPLIQSSWLESYRARGFGNRKVGNTVYFHHQHRLNEALLARSLVIVAVDAEDPDNIVGWMCIERMDGAAVVHYAYVKWRLRRRKILSKMIALLEESLKPSCWMYTHTTVVGDEIAKRWGWVYNPYLLYMSLPEGWERDDESDGSGSEEGGVQPESGDREG